MKRWSDNKDKLANNQYGYTLIIVIMALVVISVLGVGLMGTTATTLKQSNNERVNQAAYYIAEAGIVSKKKSLDQAVNIAYNDTKSRYNQLSNEQKLSFDFENEFYSTVQKSIKESTTYFSNFEQNSGESPKATVSINRVNREYPIIYKIKSIGEIGRNKRTVVQSYTVTLDANVKEETLNFSNKYAVHVSDKITLEESGNIFEGEIATESNNIKNISIPDYYSYKPKINISTPIQISLPTFPNNDLTILEQLHYPTNKIISKNQSENTEVIKDHNLLIVNYLANGYKLDMTGDMKFDEIILANNFTLIINVGNTDKKILVNHLNVTNGHIKIIGSGKLTFYVKNQITTGSGSTINSKYTNNNDNNLAGDISKLQIYYKGDKPIEMSGSQKIYGSLYAQQADVNITAGAGFQGDIYTGGQNISVSGGTNVYSQLFLAPNADFTLSGGGKIKGSIISKSFKASGGSSVTYDQTNDIGNSTVVKTYGDAKKLSISGDLIEE